MKHTVTVAFTLLLLFLTSLVPQTLFSRVNSDLTLIDKDSGYISVDRGKLFYEIAGQGDFVVLLHDGQVHREVWDAQFSFLAEQYCVVRYDRRSYGKSSDPTAPFSDVEDLKQLFTQLKIDRATIFGMSAGGGLAIDFTLKYPGNVSALVLVGAVVSGYGFSNHMTTRGGHITGIDHSDTRKMIHYFAWEDPYTIFSENTQAKEKFIKLREANIHPATGNFYLPLDRPANVNLSEIKVPTLVLVGEYDIPDVHAHAGVIENGIRNAKREVIPKAGHLIPMEQPQVFNQTVQNFLNQNDFKEILNTQGVQAGVNYFNTKRTEEPDVVLFIENEMNRIGYQFLRQEKTKEALELFKLNTLAYPESGNTWDSYAEALLKDGQTALAIENYQKAFELDPGNVNANDIVTAYKKSTGSTSGNQNRLRYPESIIYDRANKCYLLSSYLTGQIIRVDSKGIQSVLAETLPPIQGMTIVGNAVYVGAQKSIKGFDLKTGKMILDLTIPGVMNLNDVTADDAGNIYAGDVFSTRIYKINPKAQTWSLFVDGKGIDHPNGIFYDRDQNRILVCSFRKNSPVQAVSLADSTVITLANTNITNCDGIVLDKEGRCYVTSWETLSIYRFDRNFTSPPELFYTNKFSPADISYDQIHNSIAIPLMLLNSYDLVPVDQPKKK